MAKFSSNGFTVEFDDHSDEVLKALYNAVDRGLKACGERAVGYAQQLCPVDSGNLRGSITYDVDDEECYIGTNVEYGKYVEFGTGVCANGGRKTPWAYEDSKGNWHRTTGQKPQPFIKPAAENHTDEYKAILVDSLENA